MGLFVLIRRLRTPPLFIVIQVNMMSNIVPNRLHHSNKEPKRKLKPQAVRARVDALKALKRKLKARG